MSTMKRCISLLLVLGILLGVLAPAAQAAPVEETATVNTDNVTTEGIKDFSNPLGTYDGHTYVLFDGVASNWDEAREYCVSLGGHLATITSAEENTFLFN